MAGRFVRSSKYRMSLKAGFALVTIVLMRCLQGIFSGGRRGRYVAVIGMGYLQLATDIMVSRSNATII